MARYYTTPCIVCGSTKRRRGKYFCSTKCRIKWFRDHPGEELEQHESQPENFKTDYRQNSAFLESRSKRITSLDELLAYAEVDLSVWDVDRYIVNKWEVGAKGNDKEIHVEPLIQVKAWLKRKAPQPIEEALKSVTQQLIDHPVVFDTPDYGHVTDPHMLEISPYDHHFGLLAWNRDTGNDYDLKIAEKLYVNAVNDIITKTSNFNIDKILLVIGQDFFHINDQTNQTPKNKNRLDVDSRLPKIFETGYMAVINAVNACIPVSPVEIVWIPGNHDPESSWYLAKYLEAYYRNCESVTVDASPVPRKYKKYGINLIGFTHGDEEPHRDLPAIMAAECRDIWSSVRQCEWHLGHVHKRKETKFLAGDTFGAVGVRVLPSLCGTDAWHYKKGYVKSQKAAEAYLWSYKNGYTAHVSSNARMV